MKLTRDVPLTALLTILVSMFFITCGDEKGTDPAKPSVPTVTTAAVSDVTQTSAQCGGTVTSDGGATITECGVCWSTNPTPTLADNKTVDAINAGSFISSITGLTASTLYYVKAYATNSAGTGFGEVFAFFTGTTVTDIDGNEYQIVAIGAQVWMAENLKVTHYRNGDPVTYTPDVVDPTSPASYYCNYSDNEINVATYGRLYNWHAVNDSRNIAPEGWHVPTDAEWKQLEMYLGMSQEEADGTGWRGTDEGGKMKEAGETHWAAPNTGATDEKDFTALPGGLQGWEIFDPTILILRKYEEIGAATWFWSSTENPGDNQTSWYRHLHKDHAEVYRGSDGNKWSGLSIRCVKD
ncbi:MAG: fibrobacter succinogenes major paralogous domain-containing protein [Candidatus Zixiibacteriota bacterium]|nr:MAG: fibrobacter succinogenes major paralogous domain-containing protein [candidate division Zixibacteria bacterium]